MAAREQLILDILANDRASPSLRAVGRSASAASDDVKGLAGRLDDLGRKSADARVGIKGDAAANLTLDKLDAKMIAIGRRLMNPDITIEGAAKASLELGAISVAIDKVGAKAKDAAGGGGKTGLSALIGTAGAGAAGGGAGIAGLVVAAAALSPVIVTLATGLGGFGLAAYTAATNTKLMGPVLTPLKRDFSEFAKSLQPEVLGAFGQAAKLAEAGLHDIQPVAAATGKALGDFLGQVGKELQSGTWQQFFGFMAKTAAPDMRLLGNVFTGLLGDLPPLIEKLQPLAAGILKASGSLTVMISNLEKGNTGLENFIKFAGQAGTTGVPQATHSSGLLGAALHFVADAGKAGSTALRDWTLGSGKAAASAKDLGTAAEGAGTRTRNYTTAATAARTQATLLKTAVTQLTAAFAKNDSGLLTLQGDVISWKQSLQAALKQLNSNSAGLSGNTKNALANKAAVLASSQAAQTLAEKQLTMRDGMQKASDTIQAQIKWLQEHGDKSAFAAREIQALRDEEAKIKRDIRSSIVVAGSGNWRVTAGTPAAQPGKTNKAGFAAGTAGAPPGWAWTGEKGPELVHFKGGETVLPSHVSTALAGTPRGFASGVLGSFSGSTGGLTKWIGSEMNSTIHAIQAATAAAVLAGIRAARSSAQTFAGGLGRASLRQIEDWWIGAGGPGGGTAHVAAAITGAESGFNPKAVQQGQPYATTGWGLWQITPGNSEPQAGINQQLLNGPANAVAAVAKYRAAGGFSPWTTFVDGAYQQFMDRGGWVPPGRSTIFNGTGRPEHLVPAGEQTIVIEFRTGAGATALERGVIDVVQNFVIKHGGDAQTALGQPA